MKFKIGDQINKIKGYPFPGEVRSVFANKNGDRRLVVESTVLPGMLHIFNEDQMCDAGEREPFDMKAGLEALGGEWSTAATDAGPTLQDLKEILTALRDLHDEQNGPPLHTTREKWQEAYDKAVEVLEKYGA